MSKNTHEMDATGGLKGFLARRREGLMHGVFAVAACVSIICVILICVFLFGNAIPTLREIGLLNFLSGTTWRPGNDIYGILPMILGSIYVTAGALVVGVPIALLTSIFMARFCPKRILRPLTAAVNLLAGIPSVVYGFFGLTVMVPMVREHLGGNGNSMLTASLLLGMMILPTIIGVALSSIRAVPESYYEGSLALGASHERSVFFVVFPAAKSGVMAGVILGVGRAIGETMAVIMVAGNQPRMPKGILEGVRTLTTNIVMEMGYASGMHREALIATAAVLFVFILIINFSFSMMKRRSEKMSEKAMRAHRRRDPLSVFLRVIVWLAALITVGVFVALVGYILIKGVPNLSLDLFQLKYTSDNCSMLPAIFNTIYMTLLSLVVRCRWASSRPFT